MPKMIDGDVLYSIGEVAKLIGRMAQTIRLWDEWSEEQTRQGLPRYIPTPVRVGEKGVRHFKQEDLEALKQFAGEGGRIAYGSMSKYNRTVWGERGSDIKIDKSIERRTATE